MADCRISDQSVFSSVGKKVFLPKVDPFEGLFGVFADSLPDGWGVCL